MDKIIKIFHSPYELAEKFAGDLVHMINDSAEKGYPFTVALSGGTTPELLFSLLGDHFSKSAPWKYVHFFWGDERCVPPESPQSNYGMVNKKLFQKISIPSENIHRIMGEEDPVTEVSRYSKEIADFTSERDGIPVFNMIMLGLGEDGHTASIFPGQLESFNSEKICEISVQPLTMQRRITISGKVINNADSVVFLVTGKKKADIVRKILKKTDSALDFPASYVVPKYGNLSWYIDEDAGLFL